MLELLVSWRFWFVVAGAVVVIAAGLLIAILLTARGIEREAARALSAARRIEANTRVLPGLEGALQLVKAIGAHVGSAETKTRALADAVHGAPEEKGVGA